ncbi:zinc ribbon domain-containing protein [Mycobacterium sp. ML4]
MSNLSVASFLARASGPAGDQLRVEQIVCTPDQQQAAARAAKKTRDRQRALDRSRRNTNPEQYSPSARQHTRAERRAATELSPRQVTNPGGARAARADGVPLRAYRRDELSGRYHTLRADHAQAACAVSQAKHARATQVAAGIVAAHGNAITIEDCRINTWARLWGKRIALFSPGMLLTALAAECAAAGGKLHRAGTRTTAMSQHCLCGERVSKTLSQRTHRCPACGLVADRDIIAAILAASVEFTNPEDPSTAVVNYQLAHTLGDGLASQQEWEGSVNRHQPPPPPGERSARTGSHHRAASAEQAAPGPPPNRPGKPGRHGTSRKQPAPKLIGAA